MNNASGSSQRKDMDRSGNATRFEDRTPHTDELRDTLSEAGTNIRQAVSHAMPAAREQLQRAGESAQQYTQSMEQSLTACIREKPINSVMLAAGLGMIAGLILFRR